MSTTLSNRLAPLSEHTYAVLRIVAGAMFMFHGVQKIFGVLSEHQPPVGSQMWIGGVLELACAAAIVLGFFTRAAAFLASGMMAVAYLQFHWKFSFDATFFPTINHGELALLYSFVFLYMACKGDGPWSLRVGERRATERRSPQRGYRHGDAKAMGNVTVGVILGIGLGLPAVALSAEEAPSTVNATYVKESATVALKPGEKIENLFTKNASQDHVLQRLTDRIWFFQSQYYGSIFYVGDEGVLVFDALEGRAAALDQAIEEVTTLPLTALVYSHNHADHIADAAVLVEQNPGLRIIATQATAELMERLGSKHPEPTEIVDRKTNSFAFEDLTVRVEPLEHSGHAHDHAIYVLEGTGVIHVPDVINPDQPPFWSFAGAESYLGYREVLETIDALEWDYLSGGHGNVGSRDDVEFYRTFLDDLEAAAGQALGNVPWGAGVESPEALNAHTAYLSSWIAEVGRYATNVLRPKYGKYYGFEYATPRNAEMVAWKMFSYR